MTPGDIILADLPTSAKRFPDGAQYRVEIPSVEGPEALEAVFAERRRYTNRWRERHGHGRGWRRRRDGRHRGRRGNDRSHRHAAAAGRG